MEIQDQLLCLMIMYCYMRKFQSRSVPRIKDNNSILSGYAYTLELLNGSNIQCQNMMRMSRVAYIELCNLFKQRGWVQGSRYSTVEEKMAIFLHVISHNDRFINIFQQSTQTAHKYFHEVLNGMMEFAKEIIVPTTNSNVSRRQRELLKIFPVSIDFFKFLYYIFGAIGALDGTLIHAIIPADQQARYSGRGRGECYQNILGVCDFNMIFTFVWAGWEGVAHDSIILTEVSLDPYSGFPVPPPNKYYLCDTTYTNTRGFLTPYHNIRYWLAEFRRQRALSKEEKFNHAHAKLRNVIERAYGVLKARFSILKQMAPYSFSTRRDIVIACIAVHNFIRKKKLEDELFERCDQTSDSDGEEDEEDLEGTMNDTHWGSQATQYMNDLRDQIALKL
ncbi:uncharacterized protein LOC141691823 [Apium graveolens]|uniref:uncharacterized protein LOC141691823 n=1 Tax=Apium graveolens TaxID=4045 RepID=UPI003D7A64E4